MRKWWSWGCPRTVVFLSWMFVLPTVTLCEPKLAHADDSRLPAAETSFRQGMALLAAKDYAGAKVLFGASIKLKRSVGALANLAECEIGLRELLAAHRHLEEARDMARETGDDRLTDLESRRSAVERRLPKIVLRSVRPLAELSLTYNGAPIPPHGLARPLPVDPGRVHLLVSVAGRTPWESRFDIQEAEVRVVDIPDLSPAASAAPSLAPPQGTTSAPSPFPLPRERGARPVHTVLSIGLASVGLVGLGLGAYFGASAQSMYRDSGCTGNVCPTRPAMQTYLDSQARAHNATIFLVAGGIATLGGALYFAFTRGGSTRLEAGVSGIHLTGVY